MLNCAVVVKQCVKKMFVALLWIQNDIDTMHKWNDIDIMHVFRKICLLAPFSNFLDLHL